MTKFQTFAIRAIAGLIFAVVLTRFFRQDAGIPYIIGLWIILVGLAYFAEYLRGRKRR